MQISREKSEWVRLPAAARYLGVNAITVRYWVRWGWLNAYTIGPQTFRIKASDLRLLRRLAREYETDVSCQVDTRFGSILRDSPELFGTFRNTQK